MNEQHDIQPPVDLPKPVQEQSEAPAGFGAAEQSANEAVGNMNVEQAHSAPSLPPTDDNQPPSATTQNPPMQAPFPVTTDQPAAAQASQTPLIADDVDLIEKEWVFKAKQIVEHTRDDPYNQNKQMNEVKADYLKKRYNKDVKLTED